MKLLSYPLQHPYPKRRIFEPLAIAYCVVALVILIPVNIFTNGFDIVPDFRSSYHPTDVAPNWWHYTSYLPRFLRPNPPPCQPNDLGRGDIFRLTPSLFEYKVLSSWSNFTIDLPEQNRIDYRGAPFNSCYPYEATLDFSQVEWTQTVTTGIVCNSSELNLFMESTVTFAEDISKDMIGQYYGYDVNPLPFLANDPHDYRRAVFGALDAISTDSIAIMHGQHINSGPPILALSTQVDLYEWLNGGNLSIIRASVSYTDGNVNTSDSSMGPATIYEDTVRNLVAVVANAILLDLRSEGPNNIFLNQTAINGTIVPNRAPPSINPDKWAGGSTSFFYGGIVEPYQTWAEMLRAGLPTNITLGNITGLPTDSQMVTRYLCPTYQQKRMSSFLSSLFVGTAAMFISAWGFWMVATAFIAKRYVKEPCFKCSCGQALDGELDKANDPELPLPKLGLSFAPSTTDVEYATTSGDKEKEGSYTAIDSIQELPK